MIVQASAAIGPRFVIRSGDHAGMLVQLARAFGNEQFDVPGPRALIEYAVAHQNEGRRRFDLIGSIDPISALPYDERMPGGSPLAECVHLDADFNERHHPYCGLLSSIRGALSCERRLAVCSIGPEERHALKVCIDVEHRRQLRLRSELSVTESTAPWVRDQHLGHVLQLLEFLDRLALYLESVHPVLWQPARIGRVPVEAGRTGDLVLRPLADATLGIVPYPFRCDPVTITCPGQYLRPAATRWEFARLLAATPVLQQTYVLTDLRPLSPLPGVADCASDAGAGTYRKLLEDLCDVSLDRLAAEE
jgi:hypothetical protein